MKAATYCRFSSDQQRPTSIRDQQRNCHARARSEGFEVVADYADEAISGSDANRPQYKAMLTAAGRGEFQVLLLDDLSRLTRDSLEQEKTIRRLEFQGTRILSGDGYDSQSAARKVTRGFKGLMNEMFLDQLRAQVHRGLKGQALQARWCGGRPYGYRLKPILDPTQKDAYGQPARTGTVLEVDPIQAPIVREIYERYTEGDSCLTIARDLNARGVASPGSSWKRKTRRCGGWMSSAARVILKNPLYTGQQRWNVREYLRDPDTGKDRIRRRPRSEWVTHQVEALRIVSDDLYQRAQERTRAMRDDDPRRKCGGKPRHLLSGLLVCEKCGAHYTMGDSFKYGCSSYLNGHACSNNVRVRRDAIEEKIIGPIRQQLRDPHLVAKMAKRIEDGYAKAIAQRQDRAQQAPRELQELEARIERLRARLRDGDDDLAPDELLAALDRADGKRQALLALHPQSQVHARVLAFLPKAAAAYLKQVDSALAGDPVAASKARLMLRDMLGPITLSPDEKGNLWANYKMDAGVLLKVAGTDGRGDWI